jgi:murein DD-endopeptidase MepM/ murein hydrolase activator NlpD
MGLQRYDFNAEKLEFVARKPRLSRPALASLCVLMLGVIVVSAIALSTSFQDGQLAAENQSLRNQLSGYQQEVSNLSDELSDISARDRELYRVIMGADPIPEDVSRVGIGGTDPYSRFDGLSESAAKLLRENTEKLGELERRLRLQSISFEYLEETARDRPEMWQQTPSIMPTTIGRISSFKGVRLHPILGYDRQHNGVDIAVPKNTPVYATANGVVERIGYEAGYGHYIVLNHPKAGYKTLYAHLNLAPRLPQGTTVVRGEQIGLSGSSGLSVAPHVHYEVQNQDGTPLRPRDFFMLGMSPQDYQQLLEEYSRVSHLPSLD